MKMVSSSYGPIYLKLIVTTFRFTHCFTFVWHVFSSNTLKASFFVSGKIYAFESEFMFPTSLTSSITQADLVESPSLVSRKFCEFPRKLISTAALTILCRSQNACTRPVLFSAVSSCLILFQSILVCISSTIASWTVRMECSRLTKSRHYVLGCLSHLVRRAFS